ncbi:MAG: DNA repair protein RecO [Ktedonobacteraceae bacterium]|nr:DNA repair protein RecO [Ktedonobacteraceae bacterium]
MGQQRSYATQAVILKHSDFGEADRILTLFTARKGKFHAIAKGIRRPVSKKAGHLELLCHSQLQVAMGRNLDVITQAQSIETFPHLRHTAEIWHQTCAFYLAELVDRFIEADTPHPDTFQLLLTTLRALDSDARHAHRQRLQSTEQQDSTTPSSPYPHYGRTQLLLRSFEINLLTQVGYEPGFRSCVHCDAELQPVENGFTPTLGGVLCPNCSHLWGRPLSVNALKVLRILQRTAWEQIPHFRLDASLLAEVEAVMHGLLRFHLERDPRSWSFLEMLSTRQ